MRLPEDYQRADGSVPTGTEWEITSPSLFEVSHKFSRFRGHDAGRFQNRFQKRPPDPVGEVGGSIGDTLGTVFWEPIAFFVASWITSRENGFWRKSDIESFSALTATAAGSYPEIRMIGVAPHFKRMTSAMSSPEPSGN